MTIDRATLGRDELHALVASYFRADDEMDVDRIMSHFADDATYSAQTKHVVFTGAAEIRRMFEVAHEGESSANHVLLSIVADETGQQVATVQNYQGTLVDGRSVDMHNCNFFDVGPGGKFLRVANWTGPNRAAGNREA
jgi:ketosteroid isomerase-like protein